MSNIIIGRQLRAARILAGLTQRQLAKAVGVHERAARYWELKEDKAPTSTPSSLEQIEAVLRDHGVIVFASPTPGARLVTSMALTLPLRGEFGTIRTAGWNRYLPSNGNAKFAILPKPLIWRGLERCRAGGIARGYASLVGGQARLRSGRTWRRVQGI